MHRVLQELKKVMLPAAKVHASRKITAVATITASISGFRFVQPLDIPAMIFRYVCLLAGIIGFLWLIILTVFPVDVAQRTRKR